MKRPRARSFATTQGTGSLDVMRKAERTPNTCVTNTSMKIWTDVLSRMLSVDMPTIRSRRKFRFCGFEDALAARAGSAASP